MLNNKKLPTISCVIPTYYSEGLIEACLDSVFSQNYPKDKIEVIIVDGSSKDKTLEILKKYKIRLYKVPANLQEAEYNKGVGVSHAKNELILLIDHDNILPHENWLRNMVKPLMENKNIVATETLRFHYNPKDTALDRYFALIGGVDPVPYYLGKDAKLSWAFDKYNLRGETADHGDYYLVKFKPYKIPTIGANGFIIRRKLLKFAQSDPKHFFHTDINFDLIEKGFNQYAFVKEDIIHNKKTKFSYFIKFLIRRKYIMEIQYFEQVKKRRYAVYMPNEDKLGLLKYIVYSLTFVKPTIDALRGYLKVRDFAWFLHPFVCFSFLVVYSWAVLAKAIKK